MKRHILRNRRGATMIELLTASTLFSLFMSTFVGTGLVARSTWDRSVVAGDATQALATAVSRLEPTVRGALRVDAGQSDTHQLTVILPLADPDTGQVESPLTDGDSVSFYLADSTGATGGNGTQLWRSVNGVPDTAWSRRGTRGAIDLGANNGLAFQYNGSPRVESVGVSVTTRQSSGHEQTQQTASTEIFLRNSRYAP